MSHMRALCCKVEKLFVRSLAEQLGGALAYIEFGQRGAQIG